MFESEIDGVKVKAEFPASAKEIRKYMELIAEKHGRKVSDMESLKLKLADNDNVDADCVFKEKKFERIRRITGLTD